MSNARSQFLTHLHALADEGVDPETIDQLGYSFAEYENDIVNLSRFLVEALGHISVTDTIEAAHEIATATLSEVIR